MYAYLNKLSSAKKFGGKVSVIRSLLLAALFFVIACGPSAPTPTPPPKPTAPNQAAAKVKPALPNTDVVTKPVSAAKPNNDPPFIARPIDDTLPPLAIVAAAPNVPQITSAPLTKNNFKIRLGGKWALEPHASSNCVSGHKSLEFMADGQLRTNDGLKWTYDLIDASRVEFVVGPISIEYELRVNQDRLQTQADIQGWQTCTYKRIS